MHKDIVIVFQITSARILYDPINLDDWALSPNALVNPNTDEVLNVSPRYWKMDRKNNKVVVMDDKEKDYRIKLIKRFPNKQPLYCYKVVEIPCKHCREEENANK